MRFRRYQTGQNEGYKDLPESKKVILNKTSGKIERVVVQVRESLMDGSNDSSRYSFVRAESIQYQMEEPGYESTQIPPSATIKRIIKRNKLRLNRKERYRRVKFKGRYTMLQPKCIDEMRSLHKPIGILPTVVRLH
jgi:hypothetical protein